MDACYVCGCENIRVTRSIDEVPGVLIFQGVCAECGNRGPFGKSINDAKTKWNEESCEVLKDIIK